jgi:hypothetical protein
VFRLRSWLGAAAVLLFAVGIFSVRPAWAAAPQAFIQNGTQYQARVYQYSASTGGKLVYETLLIPGGSLVWDLQGPRAIKVRRISIVLLEGERRICKGLEPSSGEPGRWTINGQCHLSCH